MSADAKIQARIDSDLKAEGERILAELGLTTTELVRMTFRQLVMRKGLPFDVRIPNEETLQSFQETQSEGGLNSLTLEEFKQKYDEFTDENRKGDHTVLAGLQTHNSAGEKP